MYTKCTHRNEGTTSPPYFLLSPIKYFAMWKCININRRPRTILYDMKTKWPRKYIYSKLSKKFNDINTIMTANNLENMCVRFDFIVSTNLLKMCYIFTKNVTQSTKDSMNTKSKTFLHRITMDWLAGLSIEHKIITHFESHQTLYFEMKMMK